MTANAPFAGALSRRRFLAWFAGAGVAVAGASLLAGCGRGQVPATPPRVYRVGYLAQQPFSPDLLENLRALGYVDGSNLIFEPRIPTSSADELPGLAAELVRLPVDCIITSGTPAARAAKETTQGTHLPVVGAALGADPVASGLVASLGHPGGNVTGLAVGSGTLDLKRLEIFKEALPRLTRVAIFQNPSDLERTKPEEWIAAGQTLGLQVRLYEGDAADPVGLEGTLQVAVSEGVEGLAFTSSAMFNRNRGMIVDFVARSGLPALYPNATLPPEAALMSLGGGSTLDRVAAMVDKVLRGTSPSDIPVESDTAYRLVLNLKTAQALGLTIPQSVLIQATEVIR